MNYTKRDFTGSESVALDQIEASPKKSFKWTIPYRMIAPLAMTCDALIIISLAILCGVGYHLELFGRLGDLQQFTGFGALVAALFIARDADAEVVEDVLLPDIADTPALDVLPALPVPV